MSNPLVKRAYDIEYELCEKSPSFSSWTMSSYNMGLNFAWENQNIVNNNVFLHLCKQRLQDLYLTQCNAALPASSDGLIYKSYKVMPCYSNYFNKIVIPKHRYAFVKFVTKKHRLPLLCQANGIGQDHIISACVRCVVSWAMSITFYWYVRV